MPPFAIPLKESLIVELTVCFETSFNEAISRKTLKYVHRPNGRDSNQRIQCSDSNIGCWKSWHPKSRWFYVSQRTIEDLYIEEILPTSSQYLPGPAFHNHTRFGGCETGQISNFVQISISFFFFFFFFLT